VAGGWLSVAVGLSLALAAGAFAQDESSDPDAGPAEEAAAVLETGAGEAAPVAEAAPAVDGEPAEQRGLSPGAAALAEEMPKFVPTVDPVDTYLDAIEQAESEGGAYAMELTDLYQGLGQALVDKQEFEMARDAFHQGVMVVRVNSGPNSTEQTNYMFSIADVETLRGDWPAAVEVMDNIYQINAREFGEENPEMLPVLDKMYRWYLTKRPLQSEFAQYADFQRADFLAGRIATLIEQERGLGHPDTARVYRSLGQVNFLAIRYILSKGFEVEPGVVMSAAGPTPPFMEEVSVRDHYIEGRNAFERVIVAVEENPESTPMERAEAFAQYGDWHLVFKKYQTARDWYQRAYDVLAADEATRDLAEEYMGRPAPVRFMMSQQEVDYAPGAEGSAQLAVSMTVTKTGDLRKIEILDAPADLSAELLKEIVHQLEGTRFRPAMIGGEVAQVEDYIWNYSLGQSMGLP